MGEPGLPLAIAFATVGLRVAAYDIDEARVRQVSGGAMPFQYAYALALTANGQDAQAVAILERVMPRDLHPPTDSYLIAVRSYLRLHRPTEAASSVRDGLVRISPSARATTDLRLLLAQALIEQDRRSEAAAGIALFWQNCPQE